MCVRFATQPYVLQIKIYSHQTSDQSLPVQVQICSELFRSDYINMLCFYHHVSYSAFRLYDDKFNVGHIVRHAYNKILGSVSIRSC